MFMERVWEMLFTKRLTSFTIFPEQVSWLLHWNDNYCKIIFITQVLRSHRSQACHGFKRFSCKSLISLVWTGHVGEREEEEDSGYVKRL